MTGHRRVYSGDGFLHKKIIFQYLDPAQRFGFNDLDSIINYLTRENSASCYEIQSRIKAINADIIEKEAMLIPTYKSKLANELKYKQEQLSNAQSAKPKEVAKPSLEDNPDAKRQKKTLSGFRKIANKLQFHCISCTKSERLLSRQYKILMLVKNV